MSKCFMPFCLISEIIQREAELSVTLSSLKNFDIKPKMACNICFMIYTPRATQSQSEC